jgi:hypothetical protein
MKEEMNYFYPEDGKTGRPYKRFGGAHCPYLRFERNELTPS